MLDWPCDFPDQNAERYCGSRRRRVGVFVDLAGKKALAQRAEGDKADAQFLEGGNNFFFGLAPPERVFALQRGDGKDGVGAADGLGTRFRQAEVLNLALLNQFFYRAGNVLDGHGQINAMLIKEIDSVGPEPLKATVGNHLDVFRATIEANGFARDRIDFPAKFCGDYNAVANRGQGFAHEFFVGKGSIDFGGIEECDAAIDGGPDQRDHFIFFTGRTIGETHTHAAQADGRNFQVAFSKFARLHFVSPLG